MRLLYLFGKLRKHFVTFSNMQKTEPFSLLQHLSFLPFMYKKNKPWHNGKIVAYDLEVTG